MTPDTLRAIVRGVVPAVKQAIADATEELRARIKAIEERAPRDGAVGPMGPQGPKGDPGQVGDKGIDGRDGAQGPEGPMGPAGPQGDKGIDGRDGAQGLQGPDGQKGLQGEPGRDGKDGMPGRDGQPGRDGAHGLQGEKGFDGKDGKDGRDGIDGKDGLDGLGFDDIDVEFDGERTFSLKFVRGERVKTFGAFILPSVIYRNVYEEGKTYATGDAVTWAGSLWIARSQTSAKPGATTTDARAWTLAVKRGSEGPKGAKGDIGPQGPRGPDGKPGPERW